MKLKIGHREGIYDLAPNNTGVYVFSYKENKAFFCIAKIFKRKDKDEIALEKRKLTTGEAASKRTTNYIRLNAELLPKLIKLLQEFCPEQVEEASKSGKEERELEELIGKIL